MAHRNNLLALLQILQRDSDENHPLTTAQVRKALESKGIYITVYTLRQNIEVLREGGYKIQVKERNGVATTYAYVGRSWNDSEVRLLVDAVSAAQFISVDKSRKLIRKLSRMTGPSERDNLNPRILVSEHIKAPDKQMAQTVQSIHRAISNDRKITFRYLQYTPDRRQIPKHLGTPEEHYVISPYATIWNNDRYYLVGYSDRMQKVITFRIDRMEVPKQLQQKRVPAPENYDIRNYTDKVFWMYDGREETIILRCKWKILDQVIDRFGEDVAVIKQDEDTFDVQVQVCLSGTFFAWLFQFVGEMWIAGPESIRNEYVNRLSKAINMEASAK